MERITIKGENLELEAPEGTMQFLAGTRDVGYYSNDFQNYRDRFIPDLSVFVEYPWLIAFSIFFAKRSSTFMVIDIIRLSKT